MKKETKILTVIVSYNFTRWLNRCLDSLRRSECPTDVMVVDNASQDETCALIRRDYPEVMLRAQTDNLGFGRANNLGMTYALQQGYDYVFLLNQDAWIDPNTLSTLVAGAERSPEYGILSPIHLTGRGDRMDRGFADYVGTDRLEALPQEEVTECGFINAAFWLIPCGVLRTVGGFSPLFYHYGEDVDYLNRLHHHGYRLGYVRAFGYHDREYRPTPHEKELRLTRIYLKMEFANPLHRLPWGATLALGGALKHAWLALKGGSRSDAWYHLQTAGLLLRQAPQIIGTRAKVSKPGAHFIL
jgi:GT2 family glycosyltransferase